MRKFVPFIFVFLFAAAIASAGDDASKPVLCAYFLPTGNHKVRYCTKGPLEEAQKQCDAKLKAKKIEGTCDCTDDASFIGDRCK